MERALNLKKGDKCIVAIERGSNASRYYDMHLNNIDEWTFEGIVKSAGKKYITVEFKNDTRKFCIEDNYREQYRVGGADYCLYKNKEEVFNTIKRENLLNELFGSSFNRSARVKNLTLDQLERINAIIEE